MQDPGLFRKPDPLTLITLSKWNHPELLTEVGILYLNMSDLLNISHFQGTERLPFPAKALSSVTGIFFRGPPLLPWGPLGHSDRQQKRCFGSDGCSLEDFLPNIAHTEGKHNHCTRDKAAAKYPGQHPGPEVGKRANQLLLRCQLFIFKGDEKWTQP